MADGRPLYRHVAEHLARWAAPGAGLWATACVGAVVGATYPAELAALRAGPAGRVIPRPRLWRPGRDGRRRRRRLRCRWPGAIVNNSRGLTFAYKRPELRARFGDDWQGAIDQAVSDMIADLAANTPAGELYRAR